MPQLSSYILRLGGGRVRRWRAAYVAPPALPPPTFSLRVAFASAPFANPVTWTDISADLLSLRTSRGRQQVLDRIEAGTAQFDIDNQLGNYWPDNAAGLYYPNVKPCKRINLQAVYNSVTYDIYTGFVDEWPLSWDVPELHLRSDIRLECSDLISNLSHFDLNIAGYALEYSGTRVGNVLTSLGWPVALRNLDTGQSQVIATGALTGENSKDHLQLVQESERGILFIAPDGDVQYHDRHKRFKAPYTTSQATFGDASPQNKYRAIEPSYGGSFIYNDINITREGGTLQNANDSTSQTAYGKRSLSKTGLLIATDNEALSQAQYLVGRYKDPSVRLKKLTVYPQADPDNLWPLVLTLDISDRITIVLGEASISRDYHIEGVTHEYDTREGLWVTNYQLSDADNQAYWALGTAGLSELGITTKLAY